MVVMWRLEVSDLLEGGVTDCKVEEGKCWSGVCCFEMFEIYLGI